MTFDIFLDIFLDALKDSALVFPFLIITYAIIEFIERKAKLFQEGKFLSGKYAPLLGGLAGIFPQCGVSVMTAKLYESGIIKVGTLLSVFIATSDEAFALLVSNGKFLELGELILTKFIVAVIVGYIVNAVIKTKLVVKYKSFTFKHEDYCTQCGASSKAKNPWQAYLLYPFFHATKTFLFIFCVNFVFGILIFLVGEDAIINFMSGQTYFQPLIVALVGLIPNCASSVLITQLYIVGGIGFGSMFAGLSVNAGVGLAILLKNTKAIKRNLLIISCLYFISSLFGIIFNLIF